MSDTVQAPESRSSSTGKSFGWLLAITGTVAWLASITLVLERLELYKDPDHVTSCDINPWVSCGAVMQEWQAALFGFPNPFIGVVGFAVVMTIGVSLVAGARFPRWYWVGTQIGVTLAFVFIVWLWSQAVYSIHILCLYCMVVWAMMIPIFVYTTARNMAAGLFGGPERVRRAARDWAWVVTTGLILLVAASVLISFSGVFFGS
ncbi:vitamin K epoxide reductase family protein [Zhihengliuella salsuginis]|uniref:Membrane protein n=1 Tax=Zhihengliuella salsuginis TaxID=578222 RepID=A0ABQ3GD65_9MICC|nr:vitamin K epoxide reductase family protein [Zhihengliuella salsuginis]GHD01903.1 membrane protein [Zhihengliuella salsuginis]